MRRVQSYINKHYKPAYGSVQVNWGSSLASGLGGYLLLNEGGGNAQDIVSLGLISDFVKGSWSPSQRGTSFTTASAGDRIRFPQTSRWQLSGSGPWSLTWQFDKKGNAGSGADGYFGFRTAFNQIGFWEVYDDGVNLNFGGANVGIGFNLGPRPTNALHTVTLSFPGGTAGITCWIDGVQNGVSANLSPPFQAGANRLLVGALGEDSINDNVFAKWIWAAFYPTRALKLSDHLQLFSEPYSLLEPKTPRVRYFHPSAVTSRTIPSFMLTGVGV